MKVIQKAKSGDTLEVYFYAVDSDDIPQDLLDIDIKCSGKIVDACWESGFSVTKFDQVGLFMISPDSTPVPPGDIYLDIVFTYPSGYTETTETVSVSILARITND